MKFDQAIETISKCLDTLEFENKMLIGEILRMKKAKQFSLTEEETASVEQWIVLHRKEVKHLTENPWMEYSFLETDNGTLGKAKCACGEEFCFRLPKGIHTK